MAKLTPDKTKVVHGLTIHEKIIPWGAVWLKDYILPNGRIGYKKGDKYKADRLLSGGTGVVKGITVHNTDGNADAETYTRATYPNQNMNTSRVHYYVDDVEVWQNLREDEVGWHAGDGRGSGNETTIAIETLLQGRAVKDGAKAEENGALLCAILMDRHNLTIKDVYTHKHWSGKNCPINILPRWNQYLKKVQAYLDKIQGGGNMSDDVLYRVQVGAYKVRKNAENMLAKLKGLGIEGFITTVENKAKVEISKPKIQLTYNRALRRGSTGNDVRELQNALKTLNFYIGEIDGSFGPATDRAVRAFQARYSLAVDGSAGPATYRKLNEVLK